MTKTINTDPDLSFAAIGLWHKALPLFGHEFGGEEMLTVHPNPNAWGPFNEEHDIEGPLDELRAIGYVQSKDDGATYSLHFSMEEGGNGCWECLGYVRTGTYCGGCGLMDTREEGEDGEGSRPRPD